MIVRLIAFLILLSIALDAFNVLELDDDAVAKYQVATFALIAWALASRRGSTFSPFGHKDGPPWARKRGGE